MTKETLKEIIIPVSICLGLLLIGKGLSTESVAFFIALPAFTYASGAVLGRVYKGRWHWKDGLWWGVIGIAASILFSLAL